MPNSPRANHQGSLRVTLAMIIKRRAESIILPYDDGTDKLRRALLAARVPREQFDAVEAELKLA